MSTPPKVESHASLTKGRFTLRKLLGSSEAAATGRGVTPRHDRVLLVILGFPGRNRITVGEPIE